MVEEAAHAQPEADAWQEQERSDTSDDSRTDGLPFHSLIEDFYLPHKLRVSSEDGAEGGPGRRVMKSGKACTGFNHRTLVLFMCKSRKRRPCIRFRVVLTPQRTHETAKGCKIGSRIARLTKRGTRGNDSVNQSVCP